MEVNELLGYIQTFFDESPLSNMMIAAFVVFVAISALERIFGRN